MPCQTGLWFGLGLCGALGAWQPGFGQLQWGGFTALLISYYGAILLR